MRRRPTAALLALALVALAGCGGGGSGTEKTIPRSDGAALMRVLRSARDASGDPAKCPELQRAVSSAQAKVASLPPSVNKDTRDSLTNGVNNLADDARQDCANVHTTPTTTETTPTTPTDTTPTSTAAPTQTQTTPPTQTHTQTSPPAQTQPTPGNGGATTPGGGGKGNGGAPGQGKKKGDKKAHGRDVAPGAGPVGGGGE